MRTTTVRYNNLTDMMAGIRGNEPYGFAVRQVVPVASPYCFVVVFEFSDPTSMHDFHIPAATR